MIKKEIILEKLREFIAHNDGDETTCDLLIAFVNQIGVDTSSLFPEKFAIGEDVVFDCKGSDSEYKKFDGKIGKIIRILTDYEVDTYDVGNMYELRLENGETFNAFEDELSCPAISVKPTAETYPEVVVVIEDGLLSNVYSTVQNLSVELIDKDVTDSEALKDVDIAMDETTKRLADGELFSNW